MGAFPRQRGVYYTLVYMQYADGRRPLENDVKMFKTLVEPRAVGELFHWKVLPPAVLDTNFFGH